MKQVNVGLAGRGYDILIGNGLLGQVQPQASALLAGKRVFIVSDENVAPLYLDAARQWLAGAGAQAEGAVVLGSGETQKSFIVYQYLVEKLLEIGVDRSTVLLALGGGVVGDIAGFAAASLLRGLPFVQMPTTLLSQVDSSVGGKTGINTPQGKNLVGAFHQPILTVIDTATLSTLEKREILSGYAEILKYSLINDAAFFDWLDTNAGAVLAGETEALATAIETSCRAKASIVAEDETEQGVRALLNLGHTFGHALEVAGGYDGRLLHGEAVAIGMLWAFMFSEKAGFCPSGDVARLQAHYRKYGLPEKPPFPTNAQVLLDYMKRDKKAKNGQITLILARKIGQSFSAPGISEGDVLRFLTEVVV